MLKREKLKELYLQVDKCLRRLDESALSTLNIHYDERGVFSILREKFNDLEIQNYHLLIAGES